MTVKWTQIVPPLLGIHMKRNPLNQTQPKVLGYNFNIMNCKLDAQIKCQIDNYPAVELTVGNLWVVRRIMNVENKRRK